MDYNNQFSMDKYFQKNYGLPAKPKKYVFGKKPFLILILLCWIWIPLFIIMTAQSNKKIKAWEDAWNYRRTNWPAEYDKALAAEVEKMKLYDSALNKLGLVADDPDLEEVKPFCMSGALFDGYWRSFKDGTYRTSMREYTYVVFKQEQVFFYRRVLNLLEPDRKKESTLEFFYSDITSVNISTESVTPKNAESDSGKDKADEIDIERVVLIVPGDKVSLAFEPGENAEESIKGMRTLFRERKKA